MILLMIFMCCSSLGKLSGRISCRVDMCVLEIFIIIIIIIIICLFIFVLHFFRMLVTMHKWTA